MPATPSAERRLAALIISDDAARDLDAIFDYGSEHWGVDRAAAYLESFDAQFRLLCEFPQLGTLRTDVAGDVRSLTCGSHVIYFSSTAEMVTIARVLHGRMLPKRHL